MMGQPRDAVVEYEVKVVTLPSETEREAAVKRMLTPEEARAAEWDLQRWREEATR